VPPGDDQLGELGREEALEAPEALELPHLLLDALLERLVPLRELRGLGLHRVVELLDPEERAHAGQELRLVDGLRQEVVGAGLEPLDPLLRRIEGRDHDDGQDPRGRILPELATHLVARHFGHDDVEEDQVQPLRLH